MPILPHHVLCTRIHTGCQLYSMRAKHVPQTAKNEPDLSRARPCGLLNFALHASPSTAPPAEQKEKLIVREIDRERERGTEGTIDF